MTRQRHNGHRTEGPRPRRVVAMGGGTGLPMVLSGLRQVLRPRRRSELTAVVTMTDDGGSSGRIRRDLGLPPPGDLRNCLIAMSEREDLLSALFQYRYTGNNGLSGHNLGNLILAALADQTGSFLRAVEVSSQVLRTCGRILPATFDDAVLVADTDDGQTVRGETEIDAVARPIRRLRLEPADAAATPGVLEAIESADLIVIGPGSLYTSVVPNLIVEGVGDALRRTSAVVVFVANLVTEPATREFGLERHLEILDEHVGSAAIDAVLAHEGPIEDDVLERYRAEGAAPLRWSERAGRVRVLRQPLLSHRSKLRHDPIATARALLRVWNDIEHERAGSDSAQTGAAAPG